MKRIACVLMVVAACGKSGEKEKTAATGSGSATVTGSATGSATATVTGSATATAPAKKAPPATKEQRAAYVKHLRAGLAAQKANEWAKAVTELEAALAAVPGDQRALTELGWSAMNAGDYAKARKVDEEAIGVTGDRQVKAMGLYNLGLVQEKLGDKDGALRSLVASLQLRPNATVEKEVGKLGAKPEADAPVCPTGKTGCECASAVAFPTSGSGDDPPTCLDDGPPPAGLAGWHEVTTKQYWQEWTYLVDEHGQIIGPVTGGGDHGHFSEGLVVAKIEVKTIGGHRVLWVETKDEIGTTHPNWVDDQHQEEIDTSTTRTAITLCVIGDDKTPTRCPLRDATHERSMVEDVYDDDGKPIPSKPETRQDTKFDVAIAGDGTATVKLVSGAVDSTESGAVGPHELW